MIAQLFKLFHNILIQPHLAKTILHGGYVSALSLNFVVFLQLDQPLVFGVLQVL